MPDLVSLGRNRQIQFGLVLGLITAAGAVAIWNQPRIKFNSTSRASVKGRLWTRLPGVDVAGLGVRLVDKSQKFPRGPLRGIDSAKTDASGRFELSAGVLETSEWDYEIYLLAPTTDVQWTYTPAVVTLHPGQTVEGVEVELVPGVEVEGRFVDAETDDPVMPVNVSAISPGRLSFLGSIAPVRHTDEQGRFRFHLNPGEVELFVLEMPPAYKEAYPRGFRQIVWIPKGVRRSLCLRCGSDP